MPLYKKSYARCNKNNSKPKVMNGMNLLFTIERFNFILCDSQLFE